MFFLFTLAQTPPSRLEMLKQISDSRYKVQYPITLLLFFFAGVALLLLWVWLRQRAKAHAAQDTPMSVFRALARQLRVSLFDRLLLMRVARRQELPSPLTLLLSARTIRHHARAFAAPMHRYRAAALMLRVARLRRRLFPAA
ncbi:MAG: hypothetical protein WD768_00425 [Phycisphaeraceae bacterium]